MVKDTIEASSDAFELLGIINSLQSAYIVKEEGRGIFASALEEVLRLTGSEFGFIAERCLRKNADDRFLLIEAVAGEADDARLENDLSSREKSYGALSRLCDQVGKELLLGNTVLVNDGRRLQALRNVSSGLSSLRSLLALPLYNRDVVAGMVCLANRPGGYDQRLASFLQPFLHASAEILIAFQRVEKQSRYEKAQQENLHYAKSILDSMQHGLVVIEEGSRMIIDVNRAAEELIGARREGIIGKLCHNFICPRQLGQCPIIDEGQTIDKSERVLLDITGRAIPIIKTVVRRETDGVPYLIENFIDITERKEAEEELRRAHDLSETILNAMHDPIALIDVETMKVMNANKRFKDVFGRDSLGKKCHAITHNQEVPCGPPSDDCPLQRSLLSGAAAFAEHIHRNSSGADTHVEIGIYPIKCRDGRIQSVVHVERDITARKEIEYELRRGRDAAIEASAAKSMFLANMSHEIRTPMNGIIGFTDMLLSMPMDEKQSNYLGFIKLSANRLLKLVNDILDFSRIEAGMLELAKARFDPCRLLDETLSLLKAQAVDKGLSLSWSMADDVPPFLVGDPDRLAQVLVNVVANAIKFTPQGEVSVTVTLETAPEEAVLHFSVKDTGIGIPAGKLEAIFYPFTQADYSHSRKFKGSGLGLSIARKLVTMMGGLIWAESNGLSDNTCRLAAAASGNGSTFHLIIPFSLPSQVGPETEHREKNLNDEPLHARKEAFHVLLAEDEATNQALMVEIIRRQGWMATVVSNGKEVLEALERGAYDLILMDVQMPEMDGYEATRRIREKEKITGRHIPIIAVTAYAMSGDRAKCLDAGMDDYLAKPLSLSDLFAVVGRQRKRSG